MKLQRLTVILPVESLEGYALGREADRAEEILSSWSALYHPTLLATAQTLPRWISAQEPPKDPTGTLIMLPQSSEKNLAAGWLDEALESDAVLIRGLEHREEMVDAALDRIEEGSLNVDPELVADFLALGFCHLQIEVLIREAGYDMGNDIQYYDEQYYDYTGHFDRDLFQTETIAAAEAAHQGDEETARERLGAAFGRLTDARRGLPYTYSTDEDPHLIDLTLVAPTTLGEPLRRELVGSLPVNLLVSGQTIQQMAREEPATLAALKEALDKGTAALVGGEFEEDALPFLTPEAIVAQLELGRDAYLRHLGQQPVIFGRRRFGLTPVLPQILRKFGFSGALHFTLDDGRFPTSTQSKIWWVGMDGTELESLAQLPLDAGQSRGFLDFATKVSNTSYHEHNTTAVLAHWPGQACAWCQDLRRAAAYGPVLGEFRTVTEYLDQSESISERTRSGPDEYRSPYLRQAVGRGEPDPISRWARYHGRRAAADALGALDVMVDMAGGRRSEETPGGADEVTQAETDDRSECRAAEAIGRFAGLMPRREAPAERGHLFLNPLGSARCILADVSVLDRLPGVGGPIRAAGQSAKRKQVVVEVPAMGFAWVGAGSGSPAAPEDAGRAKKRKKRKKKHESLAMAEEDVLRNEFFEVTIDPITGAIRAIHDYVSRDARLAHQIALRLPRPRGDGQGASDENDPERDYSVMAADEISVTSAGPVVGQIVCRGRLMSREGKRVARYVETIEARRGSPILELKIDLDVEQEPGSDPWNSYYAARFAWNDSAADVYRDVSLASRPTERPQVESPHFVDVRSDEKRITIFTAGLPYHRRFGLRKMDTLLVVRGETARSFRLGIGLDLTHSVSAALDFLTPEHVLAEEAPPPATETGWLFHVDAKNVIATRWEPLVREGSVAGFRVRLLETEGRACQAGLRSFRPVGSARKVDFRNEEPTELAVQDDKITMDFKAHEWVQVEAEFRV